MNGNALFTSRANGLRGSANGLVRICITSYRQHNNLKCHVRINSIDISRTASTGFC